MNNEKTISIRVSGLWIKKINLNKKTIYLNYEKQWKASIDNS